jgi:hypothetical protein
VDDPRFDRIAALLKALTEHSAHGAELRAELAAEIERALQRDCDQPAAVPERRALKRRARKRRETD